jgi:hypothetical protein
MADNDKRLDILISFGLSDEKANEALAVLDKLTTSTTTAAASTKELGTSNEELTRFTKDSANPAMEGWKNKVGTAGDAAVASSSRRTEPDHTRPRSVRESPG